MSDPILALRRATDLVAARAPSAVEILTALSELASVRADLDRVERELIGAARELGLAWPRIAEALGLGSRQAAEQRWLRLQGRANRDPDLVRREQREQRTVDAEAGPDLAEVRRAAVQAYRRIEADRDWDGRHSRAALVRTSLESAVSAPPGALYSLCDKVLGDLEAMRVVRLPAPLADATRRLRLAMAAAGAIALHG